MGNNILIIDDDIELCKLLKKCLEKEGITSDLVHNGMDGLNQADHGSYHLIVLDVMLPEMNGFKVLTNIRKTNPVPVRTDSNKLEVSHYLPSISCVWLFRCQFYNKQ